MSQTTPNLMDFMLGLLAPILLGGTVTDPAVARLAAAEAITAYTAAGQNHLMNVGQILAFTLTAMDNLRLSMPAAMSLTMKLKLRSNANALNRAARHNSQILANRSLTLAGQETTVEPQTPDVEETIAPAEPEPAPPPSRTQLRNQLHWAEAMKRAAEDLRANAANIPPREQAANQLWIDALAGVASRLTLGSVPSNNKAGLMRSTIMSGDPAFEANLKADPAPPSAKGPGARRR